MGVWKHFVTRTETNVHGDTPCCRTLRPSLLKVGGWWRLVAVGVEASHQLGAEYRYVCSPIRPFWHLLHIPCMRPCSGCVPLRVACRSAWLSGKVVHVRVVVGLF